MPALNQRTLSGLFFITMKNTFQISKQQIQQLCNPSILTNEERLKELFPEAFEQELKTGIWYKGIEDKTLYFLQSFSDTGGAISYGFNINGYWSNSTKRCKGYFKNKMTPATDEEVFERLKEEAVKRGFKKGVTVDRYGLKLDFQFEYVCKIIIDGYKYYKFYNRLELGGNIIFDNGIWAEICITKEEAEKELGKKITSTLSTNHIDINELFDKDDIGFYIWFLKQKAKL